MLNYLENFYLLENDLGEVETLCVFVTDIYFKIKLLSSQKKALKDNNDATEMILKLKLYKQSLLHHSLGCILKFL